MKQFKVVGSHVTIAANTVVELTKKQYDSRQHLLRKIQGNKYQALHLVQFKQGETLGIEGELDKVSVSKLAPVEAAIKEKAKE